MNLIPSTQTNFTPPSILTTLPPEVLGFIIHLADAHKTALLVNKAIGSITKQWSFHFLLDDYTKARNLKNWIYQESLQKLDSSYQRVKHIYNSVMQSLQSLTIPRPISLSVSDLQAVIKASHEASARILLTCMSSRSLSVTYTLV